MPFPPHRDPEPPRNRLVRGAAMAVATLVLAACSGDISDLSQSQIRSDYHGTVDLFVQAMLDTTASADGQLRPGPIYIANVPPIAPEAPQWQSFGTIVQCGAALCFGSAGGGSGAQPLRPVLSTYGVQIGLETGSDPNILIYKGHALVVGPPGGRGLASWFQTESQIPSATRIYEGLRNMIMVHLQRLADLQAERAAKQALTTTATVVGTVATAVTPAATGSGGGGARVHSDELFCLTPANVMTSCR